MADEAPVWAKGPAAAPAWASGEVPRGTGPQPDLEAAGQAQAAEETPEWERRMIGATRGVIGKPADALQQLVGHLTGRGKEVDAEVQERARAFDALHKASAKDTAQRPTSGMSTPFSLPLDVTKDILTKANAGRLETAGEVATGAALPVMKGATPLARIAANAGTGGLYSMATNPVVNGGGFALEKGKQGGLGALVAGGVSGLGEGASKLWNKLTTKAAPAARRELSGAPDTVADYLRQIKEKIEGKVGAKVERAGSAATERVGAAEKSAAERVRAAQEAGDARMTQAGDVAEGRVSAAQQAGQTDISKAAQRIEEARAAANAPTMTPGEFGSISRDVMAGRKAELEAVRDTEAMPLLDHALNSGAEVSVAGIPKQIDVMLKNEKNQDIRRALLKAKNTLFSDSKAAEETAETIMQRMQGMKPGTPAYRELATKLQTVGQEPKGGGRSLDKTVRGLDSARLALKSMIAGNGSEPADKFAKAQLGQVLDMVESALSKASPEYGQYLAKYRELSKPLDAFSQATGAGQRTGAALQRDSFGGDFMSSPESMGARFFRPGDEGAAAIRQFKEATGGDQRASDAMSAYVSGKLKDTPPEKWGSFLKRHEGALREMGAYDKLAAIEADAAGATRSLAETEAKVKAALSEAQALGRADVSAARKSATGDLSAARDEAGREVKGAKDFAKGVTGAAAQTEKNVASNIADRPMGKLTGRADPEQVMSSIFEGKSRQQDFNDLVRMTKHDPGAAKALRQSFGEWLTKADPKSGAPGLNDMLTRWDKARGPAESSGLMAKEHVAAVDKVMDDLRSAKSAGKVRRTAATVGGWLLGGMVGHPYAGAQAMRDVVGQKGMQGTAAQVAAYAAGDAEAARLLALPPTEKAITELGQRFSQIGALTGARESGEQKPKRARDPYAMPVMP